MSLTHLTTARVLEPGDVVIKKFDDEPVVRQWIVLGPATQTNIVNPEDWYVALLSLCDGSGSRVMIVSAFYFDGAIAKLALWGESTLDLMGNSIQIHVIRQPRSAAEEER